MSKGERKATRKRKSPEPEPEPIPQLDHVPDLMRVFRVGTEGWVHPEALVQDPRGDVYLIESTKENGIPPPLFVGDASYQRERLFATKTQQGYILNCASIQPHANLDSTFFQRLTSAVPVFHRVGQARPIRLNLNDKWTIGSRSPLTYLPYHIPRRQILELVRVLRHAQYKLLHLAEDVRCQGLTMATRSMTQCLSLDKNKVLVKWIQATGQPLYSRHHSSDLNYHQQEEFQVGREKKFEPFHTTGPGFYAVPLECALGYLLEEKLIDRLPLLELLFCTVVPEGPEGKALQEGNEPSVGIHDDFCLYSQVKTRYMKRVMIVKPTISLPTIGVETGFDVEPAVALDERRQTIYTDTSRVPKQEMEWLAYWLAGHRRGVTDPAREWKKRLQFWWCR